jgi:cysteinyl-tRNA synthetase
MEDDFDTPAAYAVFYELRDEVRKTASGKLSGLLKALGGTIGLLQEPADDFVKGGQATDIQALIDDRNVAKKAKDFARADSVRKQLEEMGIVLEDKPGGITEWRRK